MSGKGGNNMLKLLTQWKDSKNIFKFLLIGFIAILVGLEGIRLFIHNITTRLGFWMWIAGVFMTAVFFLLSMYNQTPFMDTLMDWMGWLEKLFTGGVI